MTYTIIIVEGKLTKLLLGSIGYVNEKWRELLEGK